MGAQQTNTYISSSVQLGAGLSLIGSKPFVAGVADFDGLTGTSSYVVYVSAGGSASNGSIIIQYNALTTATDYYNQSVHADGVNVTSARTNDNALGVITAGTYCEIEADISQLFGVYYSREQYPIGSSLVFHQLTGLCSTLLVPITRIRIVSTVTDGVFAGTVRLYKVNTT